MMHLSKSTIPFPLNSLYTLQPLRSALIARSGHPFKVDPIAWSLSCSTIGYDFAWKDPFLSPTPVKTAILFLLHCQ